MYVDLGTCTSLRDVRLGVSAIVWAKESIEHATRTIGTFPPSVRTLDIVIDVVRRYAGRRAPAYTAWADHWPAMWQAIALASHIQRVTLHFSKNERSVGQYATYPRSQFWEMGLYSTARNALRENGFTGGEELLRSAWQ